MLNSCLVSSSYVILCQFVRPLLIVLAALVDLYAIQLMSIVIAVAVWSV